MTTTTSRKKKQKPEPSFWSRYYLKIIKGGFALFGCSLFSLIGYILYNSYLDYTDRNKIHGEWIEIGAPPYHTEQLSFTPNGVFRNHRLIATQFEFDGKVITLNTGLGKAEYHLSGSHLSPQIHRIEPRFPEQRFILKGFEHTVQGSETGAASKRRAALSEHFDRK
ncbi:DUF2850 domain-containing protein [Vibrio sp. AND4]|uniref:DUF2850 domain-containing protein n=1 Tax=Vibrio sp. AND4 TaxID=314289 RepID=UPI00015F35A0|nr:DUF2850 domain-containing protein [Vibrio sp. AND4]EDP59819.1 hypothetical protein AND4_11694 [Vibrio sp. AND4]